MIKRTWFRLALAGLAGYIAVLGISTAWAGVDAPHQACPVDETVLLVDTASGVLCLCREGRAERSFRVALVGTWADIRAIAEWVAHTRASEILLV
jgi:hypothetical protein